MFTGSFSTVIAGVDTSVKFFISNNYEVRAEFTSYGVLYIFNIKKWMKTFDKFAQLVLERFWPESDKFGSISVTQLPNGATKHSFITTEEQRLNILKYATRDVFICIEQIISCQYRSLHDYCVYHQKRENLCTYEGYIHFIACYCLIHSNFLAPTVHFDLVEFAEEERQYVNNLLTTVRSIGDNFSKR
jgi:hypothetical protein